MNKKNRFIFHLLDVFLLKILRACHRREYYKNNIITILNERVS